MRALLRPGRDKSALSNIVAYVLLISITVALSVIVYGWLRFYVSGEEPDECSDGVNIIIRSYECTLPNADGDGGRIEVTLKNKGLFIVDGYALRVHDRGNATFGFYLFDEDGVIIKPGAEHTETYLFNDTDGDGDSVFKKLNSGAEFLKRVTFLEVQPFMMDSGKVKCKSYASQEIVCFN